MNPTPILFISDAPTSGTGLGRITRDLAVRVHEHLPQFRVATLGYGGSLSRSLGFPQYHMDMHEWVVHNLPDVWEDFSGKERGIILTIWDASRLLWLSRPENCPDPRLKEFLWKSSNHTKFELWGYFPMDATGPNGKLTNSLKHVIDGYDRVLAYSKWARDILELTLDPKGLDLDWRPHGIDTSVFYPRNYRAARNSFGERTGALSKKGKPLVIPSDTFLVGVVATNQARKDYGLAFQVVAELGKTRKAMLWVHVDVLDRHWSLPSLAKDFDFDYDNLVVTQDVQFSDDKMAWIYSACDVTLGIGMSEGFGYPIFESLACGIPCIHGADHGGAAEHMPAHMLVKPRGVRMEGVYNCVRPIHCFEDWAKAVVAQSKGEVLPAHLDWQNLWPSWSAWFTKGLPIG